MLVHSYSAAVSSHTVQNSVEHTVKKGDISRGGFVMRRFKRGLNVIPPGSWVVFVQETQCELGFFGLITVGSYTPIKKKNPRSKPLRGFISLKCG